jgi:hypothetical protein
MKSYNMEIWKDVVGFENYYEVSSYGNVRSKDRLVYRSVGTPFWKKGKILKPKTKRYAEYNLSINGQSNFKTGHRLVGEAFLLNPQNLPMVLHKDNNKLNNRVDNLEWGDGFKNMQDAVKTGAIVANKGEDVYCSRLTEQQVLEIRRLYGTGNYTMAEIGEMFGHSYRNISDVVRGKSWKHLGGVISRNGVRT